MANMFPCLQAISLIPTIGMRTEFFLNMAKAVRMNQAEMEICFEEKKKSGVDFGVQSLSAEAIKTFFLDAPYGDCQNILTAAISPSGIKDFNVCATCPHSSAYANQNLNYESIALKYMLEHTSVKSIWKIKNPKTFFRSNFIISLIEGERTRDMVVQLYYRIYLAVKKNIVDVAIQSENLSLRQIVDLIQTQLMLSTFRGSSFSNDVVMRYVSNLLESEFKKCGLVDERTYLSACTKLQQRYSYKARPFLPDTVKNYGFDNSNNINSFPNFLGNCKPAQSRRAAIVPGKPASHDKPFFKQEDLSKIASGEITITQHSPSTVDPAGPDALPTKAASGDHGATKNRKIPAGEALKEENKKSRTSGIPVEKPPADTKPIERNLKPSASGELVEPVEQNYDVASSLLSQKADYDFPLFDEFGRIDITAEVKSLYIISLYPYDLYTFLSIIRKENWIGVERAVVHGADGLFVFRGSGLSAYFLSCEMLDTEIIKCLFCRKWVSVYTMSACSIFSLMNELGVYIFPELTSLSAKYNAANNSNILCPAKEMIELIGEDRIPFHGSSAIRLIQNYKLADDKLGKLVEKTKRGKLVMDFLYYEYALGSSMYIGEITGCSTCNLNRLSYLENEFSFDGLHQKVKGKTICSFHLSLSIKGENSSSIINKHFMLQALSSIFKCSDIWRFYPVLLFYNEECITMCFSTTNHECLSIIEECVCRIFAKCGQKLRISPPFVHVAFHQ